ncbi:TadE/TadG family type IV pilus assembly protein [Litchfieldella rifensis]|uniref:TadE/TadG family type IV pilus assembly protein n=1 Tax=Litchfieldella rifensis TaxID=762643 RepID=A0ABV7LLQ7_9GAMM
MNMGRSLYKQKGSELVEFAISAVVLFLLLFGIIEFSVALFDKATLTNASREGARTGILFRPADRDPAAENAAIEQVIRSYAEQYLISLGETLPGHEPSILTITIERPDSIGDILEPGHRLIVTITYDYQYLVLPGFIANLGGEKGEVLLSSTTVMRAE